MPSATVKAIIGSPLYRALVAAGYVVTRIDGNWAELERPRQ
jgi:hypothetical protein